MKGISITFTRSSAQDADLQALIEAQQNPASPLFHQWLTPEQFGSRFGIADSDLSKVKRWLQRQGFAVEDVSRSRNGITFSGTAGQVASAFGTSLHTYRFRSGQHFAPATELSLPLDLAPLVAAVLHLNDLRPQPQVHISHPAPQYTTAQNQTHYLTPLDVAVQYDLQPLYAAGHRGSGQGIAIVGQSSLRPTDYNSFAIAMKQGGRTPTMVLVPSSGVEALVLGDEAESDIDTEYSGLIAPAASIFFVFTGDNPNYSVYDALRYAVTEDVAPIISISYGTCESDLSPAELMDLTQSTQQANVQGQTVVASSGDSGSSGCFYDTVVSSAQRQALAVSVPASLANVTAVGGLQMALGTFTAGNTQYFAPASGADVITSLKSYVPETVWNEDSASNGRNSGGGGSSVLVPRPTWQTGVSGIAAGSFRLVPDLALQSSVFSPGYVFCSSDASSFVSGQINSCYNGTLVDSVNQSPNIAGGTSFAAPILAGMLALLSEATHNAALGNINPVLYQLAGNSAKYAAAFHDITTGGNQCNLGPASCPDAAQVAYAASAGYDQASGLGSVDLENLVSVWPSTPSLALSPTATLVGLPSFTLGSGSQLQASVSVNAVSVLTAPGSPAGTLKILLDGLVIQPALPISYGNTSFPFTVPSTTGSHILAAFYSGNAQFSASTGSASFDVGSLTTPGSFSLTGTSVSVPANGTGSGMLTVTPTGGYTGLVNFSVIASASSPSLCYSVNQLSTYAGTSASIPITLGTGTACKSPVAYQSGGPGIDPSFIHQGNAQLNVNVPSELKLPIGISLAGLLLCTIGRSHRRTRTLPSLLTMAFSLCCCVGLVSCGKGIASAGGAVPTPTPTPTPTPQTVVLTVTGVDSIRPTATASTTFTATVGQ